MRWLDDQQLQQEDGAAAVIVGVLMLMLIGFAAFAVDAAALYQEKRELQNGADAAAVAAAQECIYSGVCDNTAHDALADDYADSNANDDASTGDVVSVDTAAQTLTARASTEDASNAFGPLRHWFAWAIGTPETTVTAEATVSWGPPSPGTKIGTLPLALSNCDLERGLQEQITNYGASTSTNPPGLLFPTFPAGGGLQITFHNPTPAAETCTAIPGFDSSYDSNGDGKLPAGFSWLKDDPDGSCIVETMTGDAADINPETGMPYDYVVKDPGVNVPTGCIFELNKTYAVPIFKDYIEQPGDDYYRIKGYIGFHLRGYRFPSQTAGEPCTGASGAHCIRGYFTAVPVLSGEYTPGAPCSICVIGFES